MLLGFFIIRSFSLNDLMRLSAFSQLSNLSLSFKNVVSLPYINSPLFLSNDFSIFSHLIIANSYFQKVSMPLIYGITHSIKIQNTKFNRCVSPIYINCINNKKKFTSREYYSDKKIELNKNDYENCNSPTLEGGCLYLSDVKSVITKCYFFQNNANIGGAIFIIGGRSVITFSNFIKNSAQKDAGAIYVRDCSLTIKDSSFASNSAQQNGGSIAAKTCNFDIFIRNIFYSGSAGDKYGGLSCDECSGLIMQCYFKGNKAGSNVGISLAIMNNIDSFNLENNNFYDTEPFQILLTSASLSYIYDNKMACSEENGFYIVNNSNKPNYVIANTRYNSDNIEKAPKVPGELMREMFVYDEAQPPFEIRKLFMLIFLLSTITVIISIGVPCLIQNSGPTGKGYTKQ
ncbi:hypothetical protein TRFO_21908 [Tritrichomonas foetus]|uniref:Right handed beta helix domain-containing protein n=1 Tax=Tritrichomonas foetus TaxID=1144522 RepID=A0A1J4KCV8_9EUKA|nr:hypothetical protein TRFO_21908 [Tritrichomonas foetus]|eukprot:OHT09257.1 hypothetical protein TRFO_21908 [Tritrichomonas foetus]